MKQVAQLKKTVELQIEKHAGGLLDRLPIKNYVGHLHAFNEYGRYRAIPPEVESICQAVERDWGLDTLEHYHRLVLLSLIETLDDTLTRSRVIVPQSMHEPMKEYLDQVLIRIESGRTDGYYLHRNDLFSKDLSVARGKLLPAGVELLDTWSGVPRRLLFTGGPRQLLNGFNAFIIGNIGFRPYVEGHWYRPNSDEFNAAGYDEFFRRVADFLIRNRTYRGLVLSSWWFDPQLHQVSPELSFLSERPIRNGARLLRMGTDPVNTEYALRFSERRRQSYERGEYVPVAYMVVWPRSELIRWAQSATR